MPYLLSVLAHVFAFMFSNDFDPPENRDLLLHLRFGFIRIGSVHLVSRTAAIVVLKPNPSDFPLRSRPVVEITTSLGQQGGSSASLSPDTYVSG